MIYVLIFRYYSFEPSDPKITQGTQIPYNIKKLRLAKII